MSILISHEIPKALFPYHNLINDYPYVLAHLLESKKYPEYVKFYIEQCSQATFSILDNSAFELGKPVDGEYLAKWAVKLGSSHVIAPDTLHNFAQTARSVEEFVTKYGYVQYSMKVIPVLQGSDFSNLQRCLDLYLKRFPLLKLIALPYDCIPAELGISKVVMRYEFIDRLVKLGYSGFKLHLLGCESPSEFLLYKAKHKALIHSVDTSAPIMYGRLNHKFTAMGPTINKPKAKLADNLGMKLTKLNLECIYHNIKRIREYWRD